MSEAHMSEAQQTPQSAINEGDDPDQVVDVRVQRFTPEQAKGRLAAVLEKTDSKKLLEQLQARKPSLSYAEAQKFLDKVAHPAFKEGFATLELTDLQKFIDDPYLYAAFLEKTETWPVAIDSPRFAAGREWAARLEQLGPEEKRQLIDETAKEKKQFHAMLRAWETSQPRAQ